MPQRAARWIIAAIVTASLLIVSSFVAQRFADWADTNFGIFDGTTADGVEPPTSPTSSGSPASLVDWDTLGFEGRNFVAGAPTTADIESFDPEVTALEPIRVYVGLDSADSVEERVDLAIAELERTGAFDRAGLAAHRPETLTEGEEHGSIVLGERRPRLVDPVEQCCSEHLRAQPARRPVCLARRLHPGRAMRARRASWPSRHRTLG